MPPHFSIDPTPASFSPSLPCRLPSAGGEQPSQSPVTAATSITSALCLPCQHVIAMPSSMSASSDIAPSAPTGSLPSETPATTSLVTTQPHLCQAATTLSLPAIVSSTSLVRASFSHEAMAPKASPSSTYEAEAMACHPLTQANVHDRALLNAIVMPFVATTIASLSSPVGTVALSLSVSASIVRSLSAIARPLLMVFSSPWVRASVEVVTGVVSSTSILV